MPKFNIDHIARALHLDVNETAFVERQLLEIRTTVFEVRYPDLKGMLLVPPERQRLNPGATNFTYRYTDMTGEADLVSVLSGRGSRVDIKMVEASPVPFRGFTDSYGYGLQEIRAAMMAGVDLDGGKARAARDAIERKRDTALLVGDGSMNYLGLTGLFRLSGCLTYTIANGDSGSPLWSMKTPDEIVRDLHGICNAIITNSNELENPDTLVLPLTAFTHISTVRMGDGASDMIIDFFLKTRQKMRQGFTIETSIKLESNSGWTGRRMMAYERNPDKVARLDSVDFEQLPPQLEGFETIVSCHARSAGVISYFPKAIAYGDNF